MQDAPIDLERLSVSLGELAREAGEIGLRFFREGAERWTKGDDSPVTEADIAVDRFLAAELPRLLDGSGWLSEETADTSDRRERRYVWIVDPIDGTRSFIEGRPEWVVSAALVEDGAPILGVVRDPCGEITYSAARGLGATRDGEPMRVADEPGLDGMRVGGQNSLLTPLKRHGAIAGPWCYALANRLVKVAGGEYDAAVARPNAHDWDIAAAHIILEEAGARLVEFDGSAPTYNQAGTRHGGLIAAAPRRTAAIAAALEAEIASFASTDS